MYVVFRSDVRSLGLLGEVIESPTPHAISISTFLNKMRQISKHERSCEYLPGLTCFIISSIFCVTGVSGGKLHLNGEESEPSCVSCECAVPCKAAAHRRRACAYLHLCKETPSPCLACWRMSMPSSELTRLRPRIQDSSWMPWWEDVCFEGVSSPQHSLCVYQCWSYRDSSEAMWGRFQVGRVLTESCTMVRASVQRDEVLSNLIQPLLIAGGLD